MKKIHMIAALLAMFAPMTQVWAVPDSHSTHYGKIAVEVATGEGTVYVSTSSTATSGQTSDTWNCGGDSSGDSKTWYIYAKSNSEDWEFKGWSTSKTGTPDGNTTSPVSKSVSTTSTNSGSPSTTTYYAHFASTLRDPFDITFAPGNYTVDGVAVGSINADNYKGLRKVKTVALSSSDENFLNWLINNESVANASHTLTCESDTTVEAVFLTADQVTTVTTIADLTSALSNAAYKKIIIPNGTSLTVAKGSTVTVPDGKQLVIDGTLNVIGTVSNSGVISGSGTLYKISYLIDQGDVITPKTADGAECKDINSASSNNSSMARYCETMVSVNTPSVQGAVGCSQTWGVLFNGTSVSAISKQNPKAVKVNIDTTKDLENTSYRKVANKILSIVANGDVDAISANDNYVLLSDCSVDGPTDSKGITFSGMVDCAGKKATCTAKTTGTNVNGANSLFLNGSVIIKSSKSYEAQNQNSKAQFINCSSVSISHIKGTSPTYCFYNCGTKDSPASILTSYYSDGLSSSNYRKLYFYSGYYSFTFKEKDDKSIGKAYVYGGAFTSNPSEYDCVPDKYNEAELTVRDKAADPEGFYRVIVKGADVVENVAAVGNAEYPTLAEAVRVAASGDDVTLLTLATIDEGGLEIPQNKAITLVLAGHAVTGGKIVNNGTLVVTEDSTGACTGVEEMMGGTVECDIENNGTLELIFGRYKGSLVNKTGTLTSYNGIFESAIDVVGGTVSIRGAHFKSSVVSKGALVALAAERRVVLDQASGWYSVVEPPDGTMVVTTVDNFPGYIVTPYISSEYQMMRSWAKDGQTARSAYSVTQWKRLAEILAFYQLYNLDGIDPTLVFDRKISGNTLKVHAKAGDISYPHTESSEMAAKTPHRMLAAALISSGQATTGLSYKRFFSDKYASSTLSFSTENLNDGNKGTAVIADVEIWNSKKTLYPFDSDRFVIGAGSNKAMIRPASGAATFYATPGAAVDGDGTILLCNDSDDDITLPTSKTVTLDPFGFNYTGTVSAPEGYFIKSAVETTSLAYGVTSAPATTYVVAQKVASVGETFYDNLTDAVGAANGATVTLLAATDETITIGEGQSLKLAVASGVSYDAASKIVVDSSLTGYGIKATAGDGYTLYEVIQSAVSSGGSDYASVEEAISDASGDAVEVTVTANIEETVSLGAGKTLSVTVNDGVEANVTVNPAEGAFIDATTDGNTTTYESKKITVEMAEPQSGATVEVTKIEGGTETTVSDSSAINAAVTQLMGNHDVPRTDNTDKLDVLDKITVTPTKIVEEIVESKTIIRSATFDVTPAYNAGQSLAEGQKLKFRLPVDAAATQLAAIVYHSGAQFGIFAVQTYNNEKYVEVESDTFSPYGYELLDGETANPVAAIGTTGYATLPDAIEAAEAQNPEPTITVLDTTVAEPTGWHFVTEGSVTTLVRTISYNVWVGGTQITSVNAADVFGDGKVSYDDATKTLTLNGYTYSGAGYDSSAVYIGDVGGATFNIVVAGENSLTSTAAYGYAIRSVGTGAVTVTGSGSDPSLALTVPSTYDTGYAVSVKGTSATFKDLSMAVTGYLGFVVNGNNAAGDALTIDNCDVVFDGTAIDQAIWVYNTLGDGTVSIENGSSLTGKGAILVYGYGTSAGDANLSITGSTVNLTGATTASASGSSRHAIEVLSNVGDSVLTIDNSTVTVTASNGLHPNGNGPDGINVGSQMSANGKGLAKIDIKNGSVVTATGNANGVNLFTWGDNSNVNPCGAELSVVDSTLNASATHATGGHYGIVAYAYQKGDTSVVFENSTVNASAPASAGIYIGAGEDFNADVGNLSYEAIDSDVTTSGPYGLVVSTVSADGNNTSVLQTVDISGGSFTCNGLLFVYGDDGENTASVSMSDVTAQIGTTTATEEPVLGTVTTGELSIDSGDYTILHAADLDAFDVTDGNIEGGTFNELVPEELCADTYIPTPQDPVTGKYTVKKGAYVAQIVRGGNVVAKYESFGAALADAQDGDAVQLLADITGVTDTFELRSKNLTIDGDGHKITAGVNADPRSVFSAWGGARNMFVVQSGNVTFKDITLDGGETHYYTFLVQAKSGTTTFDNVSLLHGGETDSSGTAGVGYGAAVQVDGATVLVNGNFCADTYGGEEDGGIFPFTALLYQTGSVQFDDSVNVDIGKDLLLVGMMGALDVSTPEDKAQVQEMLDAMNVPDGFAPYTLSLGDNGATSFTGASPLAWNDIIDYGKEIMDVSESLGMEMDKTTTPVEVGLLDDTVLTETFTYEDSNFTVNGNGNTLSGTIEYTDNAGTLENVVMGTEEAPLVLDMTGLSEGKSIDLGTGIAASNVTIKVTEEQATTLGQNIVTWNTEGESEEAAASLEKGITVEIVDDEGEPVMDPVSGDPMEASIIWDAELGVAYIGPCEARLTGPTHANPIYTSLASAIALAADSGDTVTLMTNIVNFTGTQQISKSSLVLDGAGHTIAAAPVATHRNVVNAFLGGTSLLEIESGAVTVKNITLDGDASHAYTYLISANNDSASLTTENIVLLNGGELCGDADGNVLEAGAGYGAAIHLNNGAALTVKDGFYADTHGAPAEPGQTVAKADGVFPFTGILPEGGSSVLFDLTEDTNAEPTVEIGKDLLLVGMVGAIDSETAQGILNYMKVPSRFRPYTLTLGDGSAYAFTGASLLGWNEIIDYGKEIMDVSTAVGYEGLDKDETPVEVGLLTDTVLPDTFTYEDSNFTVNGNGNALSGTIEYTDDAGVIENIVLGTEEAPLVLDLRNVTDPVEIGNLISVSNVTVLMTEEQATLGQPVFTWNTETAQEPENSDLVVITVLESAETPYVPEEETVTKGLVWDDELGIAYIGPCEARLTGPEREPGYMDLTNAFNMAVGGDTVTLFWSSVTLNEEIAFPAGTLVFATNKYELALGENAAFVFTNATSVFRSEMAFSTDIMTLEGEVASGYLLRTATDGTTNVYSVASRGQYIVTGMTEDGMDGTAVIKVSDEWIAANMNKVIAEIKTINEIEEYLDSRDATTGMRKWENYVLRQTTNPFRVSGLAANGALSTTLSDTPEATATTGFTVQYALNEVKANGEVKTPGAKSDGHNFSVNVASVESAALYKVRAYLNSGDSTLVVDSTNTLGVLKVQPTIARSIIAVPWKSLATGGDITVADYIRAADLSANDKLHIYNGSSYDTWTYSDGNWSAVKTFIAGKTGTDTTVSGSAATTTLARGTGVWLERAGDAAPLYLVGEYSPEASETSVVAGSTSAMSWNLVGAPSFEQIDLNTAIGEPVNAADRIVVPMPGGLQKNFTYKKGKWGYSDAERLENGRVRTFHNTNAVLPAGTGFWYLNTGDAGTIKW